MANFVILFYPRLCVACALAANSAPELPPSSVRGKSHTGNQGTSKRQQQKRYADVGPRDASGVRPVDAWFSLMHGPPAQCRGAKACNGVACAPCCPPLPEVVLCDLVSAPHNRGRILQATAASRPGVRRLCQCARACGLQLHWCPLKPPSCLLLRVVTPPLRLPVLPGADLQRHRQGARCKPGEFDPSGEAINTWSGPRAWRRATSSPRDAVVVWLTQMSDGSAGSTGLLRRHTFGFGGPLGGSYVHT